MIDYLNLEDVAIQRGEKIFKVARLLTRNECKLFLDFGEDNEELLCITDKMIEGNHHLFQVKKGTYPMTLNSQHECVQRLSNSNYGLSGLSFMVGKDEIRLKSVDDEDRSVCVVVDPDDVAKLPPPSQIGDAVSETVGEASPKNKFKNIQLKTNPEIHKIFWRAFIILGEKFDCEPKYKEVWQAIYDDVKKSDIEDSLAVRREFDPKEIIEKIDSIGITKTTKLFWIIATAGGETSSQGDYSLSSLPSLINKLKKDPPKI
jgi:hypothetical protein